MPERLHRLQPRRHDRRKQRRQRTNHKSTHTDHREIRRHQFRRNVPELVDSRRKNFDPESEASQSLNSFRQCTMVRPNPTPVRFPKNPTTIPWVRNTHTICVRVAPSAFITPISRVFMTVTVISVFMMLNAATITMNNNRKNICPKNNFNN